MSTVHAPSVDNDQKCVGCGSNFPCTGFYDQSEEVTAQVRESLRPWGIDLDKVIATQERLRGERPSGDVAPLDLTAANGDGLKATASEAEAGGAFLVIDDAPSGAAAALTRADTVKLRDWLTDLLNATA